MSSVPMLGTLARALAAICALCALTAAPASAHESAAARAQNTAATHAYLLATVSVQETEVRNLAQSKAAIEGAAAHIAGECPGVLAGVPPSEQEPETFSSQPRTSSPRHHGRRTPPLQPALGPQARAVAHTQRRADPTRPRSDRDADPVADAADVEQPLRHRAGAPRRDGRPVGTRTARAERVRRHERMGVKRLQDAQRHLKRTQEPHGCRREGPVRGVCDRLPGPPEAAAGTARAIRGCADRALARHSQTLTAELRSLDVTTAAATSTSKHPSACPPPNPQGDSQGKETAGARPRQDRRRRAIRGPRRTAPQRRGGAAAFAVPTTSRSKNAPVRPRHTRNPQRRRHRQMPRRDRTSRPNRPCTAKQAWAAHVEANLLAAPQRAPAAERPAHDHLARDPRARAARRPRRHLLPGRARTLADTGVADRARPAGRNARGRQLPAVVECTKTPRISAPRHRAPGPRNAPQAPAFTIRAEATANSGSPTST